VYVRVLHSRRRWQALSWVTWLRVHGHEVTGTVFPSAEEILDHARPGLLIAYPDIFDQTPAAQARLFAVRAYEIAGVPALNSLRTLRALADPLTVHDMLVAAGVPSAPLWDPERLAHWPVAHGHRLNVISLDDQCEPVGVQNLEEALDVASDTAGRVALKPIRSPLTQRHVNVLVDGDANTQGDTPHTEAGVLAVDAGADAVVVPCVPKDASERAAVHVAAAAAGAFGGSLLQVRVTFDSDGYAEVDDVSVPSPCGWGHTLISAVDGRFGVAAEGPRG
jgi:hypothetical protein